MSISTAAAAAEIQDRHRREREELADGHKRQHAELRHAQHLRRQRQLEEARAAAALRHRRSPRARRSTRSRTFPRPRPRPLPRPRPGRTGTSRRRSGNWRPNRRKVRSRKCRRPTGTGSPIRRAGAPEPDVDGRARLSAEALRHDHVPDRRGHVALPPYRLHHACTPRAGH